MRLSMLRFAVLTAFVAVLSAAPLAPQSVHSQQAAPGRNPIDIVVVLDDSGSMAYCWNMRPPYRAESCDRDQYPPSDRRNLRYSATRLLLHFLRRDDRVAVIRFDKDVEPVGSGRLEVVGDDGRRQALIGAIEPPGSYLGRVQTRIDKGLAEASKVLGPGSDSNRNRYILLLTDGKPEPERLEGTTQEARVKETMRNLTRSGVQVYPVALCNQGCPSDFLYRAMSGSQAVRTVESADDLLMVFVELLRDITPGDELTIGNTRNADGHLGFDTQAGVGYREIGVVTGKDDFVALEQAGNRVRVEQKLADENISLHVHGRPEIGDMAWVARTKRPSGFIIGRTGVGIDGRFPPSSVQGSEAAPRYVPAGKLVLIVVIAVGYTGTEPLVLNGKTRMKPLTADGAQQWALVAGEPGEIPVQIGERKRPLVVQRVFRIIPDKDLPAATQPQTLCDAYAPCRFSVGFNDATIQDLKAQIYIAEDLGDREVPLAGYPERMTCAATKCDYTGFQAKEGHSYAVRFLLEARKEIAAAGGWVPFGDWAETKVAAPSTIYVSGLPEPLDLTKKPPEGWPVTVVAGATENLGRLSAELELRRLEDNRTFPEVKAVFGVDVRGAGEQQAKFEVVGVQRLPPGHYQGKINFTTERTPAGRPIRPPRSVVMDFLIPRPGVTILQSIVRFPNVAFDPKAYTIDVANTVNVRFDGRPFELKVDGSSFWSSCRGLGLTAEPALRLGDRDYAIPLHLRGTRAVADGPWPAGPCEGTFRLAGPTGDYDVPRSDLTWDFYVKRPGVEFSQYMVAFPGVTSGAESIDKRLEFKVRFDGEPFSLKVDGKTFTTNCEGLALAADKPRLAEAKEYAVPLRLHGKRQTTTVPASGRCEGIFKLIGESQDYDVPSIELTWQLPIEAIRGGIAGVETPDGKLDPGPINLGSIGLEGERITVTVRVTYSVGPTFSVGLDSLSGNADSGGLALTKDDIILTSSEMGGIITKTQGTYLAKVELQFKRTLDHANPMNALLFGTSYAGTMKLLSRELPDQPTYEVRFRLQNPSLWERLVVQRVRTWGNWQWLVLAGVLGAIVLVAANKIETSLHLLVSLSLLALAALLLVLFLPA